MRSKEVDPKKAAAALDQLGGKAGTVEAEVKASQWLAKANERREKGLDDSREISKAQFWLDRANKLRGWS